MTMIQLTESQINSIVKSELESQLAICDDNKLKNALLLVLETYHGDNNDDVLQDIVAEIAC